MSTTNPTEATGTLHHLDPATLLLETNVRDEASIDAAFLASIKEHGVLTPIAAVTDAEGRVHVRAGQRRTLAARQAGLSTVPVYVRPAREASDTEALLGRISEQIVENDQRAELTNAQRLRGMQQLLDVGVSPTKVAKRIGVSKKTVDAAALAATSEAALAAIDAGQLDIEQAAILSEFDTDTTALTYLTSSRSPGEFDHRVAEMREKAATAARRAEAATGYAERGHTILTERPGWSDELTKAAFHRLADAENRRSLTEEHPAHPQQLPRAWSVWLEETGCYLDTRTGLPVDEDDIDWDREDEDQGDEDQGDEDQGQGAGDLIHPRHVEEGTEFSPAYFCHDLPAAHEAGASTFERSYGGQHQGQGSGDDEDAKTAQRREKRKVLALNKLGAAAQSVRNAWVTDKLLRRKTIPKAAMTFVAAQLAQHPALLSGYRVSDTAGSLLDLPEGQTVSSAAQALPASGDARAAVLVLALVLAAMEDDTDKTAWRHRGSLTAPYLRFLADNGYELAQVEKVMLGELNADDLYDTLTVEKEHPADSDAA